MGALSIELDDYWTRGKRTRLTQMNGMLSGCGISLDVWEHLFDFRDGSWFAAVYGGYHDNLTLVSLRRDEAQRADREPFALEAEARDAENVSHRIEILPVHALTPAITRLVGFSSEADIVAGGPVAGVLHLHDDFAFAVGHDNPDAYGDALRIIVRVHEHYLGIEASDAEETRVRDAIQTILEREGSIEVRSEPEARRIRVSYERPAAGWLARVFHRTTTVDEVIMVA